MSPKIHPEFWTDPDLEDQAPEIKLTLLWMMTNPATHFSGMLQLAPKRFVFETGLPVTWLEETLRSLPKMFFRIGDKVLLRNFIRHQFGAGEKLRSNNIAAGLVREMGKLPGEIQTEIFRLYPELRDTGKRAKPLPSPWEGLPSPYQGLQPALPLNPENEALPSPSKGLASPSRTNAGAGSVAAGESSESDSLSQIGKPLPSPSEGIGIGVGIGTRTGVGTSDAPAVPTPTDEAVANGKIQLRYDLASQALKHLNKKTGADFQESQACLYEIALRIHEVKGDLPGICQMIDRQCGLWKTDAKLSRFLRPETLFEVKKFHNYFGQRGLATTAPVSATDARALQEAIDRSPANRESAYHKPDATDEEKTALKKLRAELGALSRKLTAS